MLMTSLTPSKSTRQTRLELKAANNDSVAHLDQDLCKRDTELKGLVHRVVAHEDDTEENLQHSSASRHTAAKYRRGLVDLTVRAEGTQAELDTTVRRKGSANVAADTVHEHVGTLKASRKSYRNKCITCRQRIQIVR